MEKKRGKTGSRRAFSAAGAERGADRAEMMSPEQANFQFAIYNFQFAIFQSCGIAN
jgi:hypothetical protein